MRNRAKNVSADGSGTEVKTLNHIYRNEPRFTIEKIKRTKGGSYFIYPKEVEEWQRITKFEGERLWKIKPKLAKGTDGTIIPASKMGNDFLKISEKDRNKKIPSPLKNLEFTPDNKDFGRIVDVFVGKDDLRPVMALVNYDKEQGHIVCTDAHKLLLLSPKPFPKFSGLYRTPKSIKALRKLIGDLKDNASTTPVEADAKYPNYLAVIPKINLSDVKVDAQKLFYFSRVLAGAKKRLFDKNDDKGVNFSLLGSYRNIVLRMKGTEDDGSDGYRYLGVNAEFLSNSLKAFLQMHDNFDNNTPTMFNQTNTRAMVFDYTNKGNDLSSLDNMNGFLIMPTIISDFYDVKDLNIGQTDFVDEDMPTLNLVYDLDENMIYSNGALYEINEALGYKPRYVVSEHKKSESSEKSSNFGLAKRIKGLKTLYRITKDEKIKKRIKGLKLLQKTMGDLPF